jgi:predicted ATPase
MFEPPAGTVTLLFTDIEGSTRLLRQLGAAYAESLAEHRGVLRAAFRQHGGSEVDTQGDAFFFTFPDPGDAVAAAAEAQRALASGQVRVRMGLHTGEPMRTEEGWVGEDVHLGARIAAAGHGGQVLLSRTTRELVDVPIRDLGEHRLKDFDEPVWLYQLGDEPFPPLKTISNTNLPRPASSFVGREREVEEVRERVRASRLVTLTGPGGSGKTRLSIEAAGELAGEFRNGVFWIPLATTHDPALVLPAIGNALGAQADVTEHVGERELLLVLDNLEQVLVCSPELAALVEACPNLHLLVTSRELLRVRGEVEYEVLPLAEPEAVKLFCARAQLEPSPAIEELCRGLDNMPLALELAAARTKSLSPDQILERLAQRLDLFKGGRDADDRQKTLRATIEWSYELLTSAEQQLFARLAVFVGGCTIEMAEAVAATDLDTLQSLVEKSLLRHTDGRFWMLETIRGYAGERLEASTEAKQLRRRHAEHLLALADTANLTAEQRGPDRPEVIRPELDNLRAAIEWAAVEAPELAFLLAISLEQFWVINDAFEGVRTLAPLLDEHGSNVPALLRARALRVLGESTWISGDFVEGTRLMEQSLAEFERLGDEDGIAVGLHRVAGGLIVGGEPAKGRAMLDQVLAMCRRNPNAKLEGDAVSKLAWAKETEGDLEGALELYEDAARLCGEAGFTWIQAASILSAADILSELGRPGGEERAREGLELFRQLRDRRGSLYALARLARYAAMDGQVARSGRLWGALETEETRAPVGYWTFDRDEYERAIVVEGDAGFETARAAGRRLSLAEATEYALGDA